MKKIIIVLFMFLIAGFISSCTKDNSVKPSAKVSNSISADHSTSPGDGNPPD